MSVGACLDRLKSGQVVAFPTDTFHALSCDPFSAAAVARLRALKGLAHGRPLPLLIPAAYDWTRCGCVLGEPARRLAGRFWPGRLTIVVPCRGDLAARVGRAEDGAVGLRVPAGDWLQDLLARWDGPLVGTSANTSGHPPATNQAEARRYFPEAAVWVAPGESPGGEPSTVVTLAGGTLRVERAGAVSEPELLAALQVESAP